MWLRAAKYNSVGRGLETDEVDESCSNGNCAQK
jgi:hypothetical protein